MFFFQHGISPSSYTPFFTPWNFSNAHRCTNFLFFLTRLLFSLWLKCPSISSIIFIPLSIRNLSSCKHPNVLQNEWFPLYSKKMWTFSNDDGEFVSFSYCFCLSMWGYLYLYCWKMMVNFFLLFLLLCYVLLIYARLSILLNMWGYYILVSQL